IVHHTALTGTYIGDAAVYTFFVLSGFLIMGLLRKSRMQIEARQTSVMAELKRFWLGRALRIFPVYYLALAVMLSLGWGLGLHQDLIAHAGWYLAYLQNFHIGLVSKQWGPFSHVWSLAVEQQFYVLFGLALLIAPLRHHRRVLMCTLAACALGHYLLSAWAVDDITPYTMPMAGFAYILGGCLVSTIGQRPAWAELSPRTRDIVIGMMVVVIIATAILPNAENGTWSRYLPLDSASMTLGMVVLYSAFLWAIANSQDTRLVRWLEIRPLRYAGQISYALYVVHFPLIEFNRHLLERTGWIHEHLATTNFFMTLIGSALLASLSMHLMERPIAQAKGRILARCSRRADLPLREAPESLQPRS
ncbi:peptidoglycan/LPS O-acetylase OafA/YrhL, partial [Sphaerotilus hippei]